MFDNFQTLEQVILFRVPLTLISYQYILHHHHQHLSGSPSAHGSFIIITTTITIITIITTIIKMTIHTIRSGKLLHSY
jgi:hypothetical protein